MDSIDVICDSCGTANRAGAEFCQNCKAFLAWNRGHTAAQPNQAGQPNRAPEPTPASGPGGPVQTPPTRVEAAPPPGQPAWASYCTWCGAGNPAGRHLCRRCGLLLDQADPWSRPTASAAPAAASTAAYQRAVPGWYRGRMLTAGAGITALVVLLAFALPSIPKILPAWDDAHRSLQPVPVAGANVAAGLAVDAKAKPAALIDGTYEGMTLRWNPQRAPSCAGWITLQLAKPTRIAQVKVYPGLEKDNPKRDSELRPGRIGIQLGDGGCTPTDVTNDEWLTVDPEDATEVTTVRVGILAATAKDGASNQVSVTEIVLYTR